MVLWAVVLGQMAYAADRAPGEYDQPRQVGRTTYKRLSEVSGITASRTMPGIWWVHNDSGHKPQIYAIESSGTVVGVYDVAGALNRDWEDIAGGPGNDGFPALYIADIGANQFFRKHLSGDHGVIYRVREPDHLPKGNGFGVTESTEAFRFRYPDGQHDAEAIFVDPESGRVYIVTKADNPPCGVFRFPLPLRRDKTVVLEAVDGSNIPKIRQMSRVTGAATSADGTRVVIRTLSTAIELRRSPGSNFESLFSSEPVLIHLPPEREGEGIAYTPDGMSLVTTGEQLPAPIHQMTRRSR